ncbi:hypothetical protein DPMN_148810 [Dreissena polymorpha]|uniref:Mutator-like transposase domain-containing protein n=1 Tax=Dreissena polymorpha TaxID=45954 RepID=A0A9D4J0K8_DREPO|nr:hypothetical protein DPMN_148810 [Dreissena polymorpha]
MVHAGVGVRQINSILSTINIPAVNHTMLIRRQNEAGQAVEEVAKSSADTFLQEEVHLNVGLTMRLMSVWMQDGRKEAVEGRMIVYQDTAQWSARRLARSLHMQSVPKPAEYAVSIRKKVMTHASYTIVE